MTVADRIFLMFFGISVLLFIVFTLWFVWISGKECKKENERQEDESQDRER